MPLAVHSIVRFGSFELRSTQRVLLSHGSPVPLGSRALDVLMALVAHQGALVTKDELLNTAWPGLVVEEANVHVAVSQLRKVLGKPAISTVGGLGYRFALPLHSDAPEAPEAPEASFASVAPVAPVAPFVAVAAGLPQQRWAFVGRQAELADAAALLQQTRLLTLVAMGGMGKTRLALQLAQQLQLQGRYADGVCFVDLQPLQDGSAVPAAVARALALASAVAAAGTATAAATTDAVLRHLQQRQLLLVLDNCEHLLPGVCALLSALLTLPLPPGGGASVLATSRQALDLPGERVFALRPLQLPGAAAAAPRALGCEAVQMFLQRVLADNPGFAIDGSGGNDGGHSGSHSDGHSGALVLDICRRLDGIPLALELAAARLKMLSLQQLHTLLAQRFELLSHSGANGPSGSNRRRTLQDVLQWSFDHLDAAEQNLAQAVAVCSGGFDLDAAAALMHETRLGDRSGAGAASHRADVALGAASGAVSSPATISPVAVLDSLAQLADRALIHVTHGADTARYGMLETVREYLLAQLARSGGLHAARQRHLTHFHALALQAEAAAASPLTSAADAARWAARLDAERDNLLSALAWCLQLYGPAGQPPAGRTTDLPAGVHTGVEAGVQTGHQAASQTALQMVAALKNFWFATGWLEQGLRGAESALAAVAHEAPTALSARVQRLAAQLCLFMSRLDEGALHAQQALAASQTLGDEAGAAAALCFAGRIAVKSENTASGEQLLHEGLRRARQAQALAVVGEALNALAFAAIERDDLNAAEAHFAEALLASQQRGSALGGVIETLNLAWVTVMKSGQPSDLERARELLLSVWRTLQRMPHRYVAQELVDVCASHALQCGAAEDAALLHAASATQRQAMQLPLTAKQATRRAAEVAAVRAALDEAGYEAAAAAGREQQHVQTLAQVGAWLQCGPAPAATRSGRTPRQPV